MLALVVLTGFPPEMSFDLGRTCTAGDLVALARAFLVIDSCCGGVLEGETGPMLVSAVRSWCWSPEKLALSPPCVHSPMLSFVDHRQSCPHRCLFPLGKHSCIYLP